MNYLILNQLGTPQAPTPEAVGIYLNEFLMDPDVVSIPRPIRDILVKAIIVPRRRFASAEKYQKVWTDRGSPLSFHTDDLRNKLQSQLGGEWTVLIGMRYGSPSIAAALASIDVARAERIVFLPLYPQFADATVGSAFKKLDREAKRAKMKANFLRVEPFFDRTWYQKALCSSIAGHLNESAHLLLSYHGIPVAQEKKSKISYYQQCLKTSQLVQKTLKLNDDRISTAFQSRLGPTKWLEPSSDRMVEILLERGVNDLVVACPSFVADCLETIEEIGMELKHKFLSSGGKSFKVIPCLNDDDLFVSGLVAEVRSISGV